MRVMFSQEEGFSYEMMYLDTYIALSGVGEEYGWDDGTIGRQHDKMNQTNESTNERKRKKSYLLDEIHIQGSQAASSPP